MSYPNFVKALELAPECEFYTVGSGKSEGEIALAEALLGVTFSRQCREFYGTYGYLSFFGVEIFGVDPDDDSFLLEGNAVACARSDRMKYGLPREWIPVYNFQDGSMAYFDYASLNEEGEPRVIMAFYNGTEYEVADVLAEDFGDFLLNLVREQLEE